MAEEEVVAAAPVDVSPVSSDHKRKLEDLEPQEEEEEEVAQVASSTLPQSEAHSNEEAKEIENSVPDAKRPRLEEESESVPAVENGHQLPKVDVLQEDKAEEPAEEKTEQPAEEKAEQPAEDKAEQTAEEKAEQPAEEKEEQPTEEKAENPEMGNQEPSIENPQTTDAQHSTGGDSRQTADGIPEQGDLSSGQQQSLPEDEGQSMTRKMEVPNNKVGVLIGKAGDTIRFLQYNSGAKIQITRDVEADPHASTRPVELIGSLENINKAEKLIKDVIAEADAGGSPSLVARGFGTVQASGAAEQIQIQVPNEKVGLIIGKGGETIKNLQTRSGARIQLIPQHLPEGDQSKERIVRVSGDKKQIEVAREMIKEVMNQQPVRQSPLSGGYNQQQNYRPRGPTGQWGPRGPQNAQGYDYPQRGMYPSQNPQYMPPSYGGYPPQQSGPRGNFNAGWDQRSSGHAQGPSSQATGYDYYGQGGGHMSDGPAPGPVSNAAAPHGSASAIGAPSSQVNYNYGQPQGMDYGHPNTYSQNAPPQQSYGHGYEDPKYPNQGPAQPGYGGHGNSQAGAYPQQGIQPGYGQQPYGNKPPAYNMPPQGPPQAGYGMPRTSQPGEMPYQGPNPSNPSYGSTMPAQQGYPYSSGGPTQQTYPYGSAPVANDGYSNQAPPHAASAPGYPQQQGPQSGYGQPGVQPAPGYAQGGAQGGYGPYPTQPGYGEQQPVANNAAYGGYQGHADPAYNSGAPTAAYGAPPSGQAGYVQPAPNQPGYEQQPMPQGGGYGNVPGAAAPGGYAKNVSPQPAAYNQYDTTQMYGGHH